MVTIVDGNKIKQEIQDKISNTVSSCNASPTLTVVTVGADTVTKSYLKKKRELAESVGVGFAVKEFDGDITTDALIHEIEHASSSKKGGLVVQLPLPSHIDTQEVLNTIPVEMDVDVLSEKTLDLFIKNKTPIFPPVVGAVKEIVERHNVSLKGKNVVVVGQGKLVGRPIAFWLTREQISAKVLEKGDSLEETLSSADVVITGTGVASLIKPDMVKEGVVLIDAGTSESGGQIRGDVDPSCAKKASLLTPVPGGVGPITVAVLLRNVVTLACEAADA